MTIMRTPAELGHRIRARRRALGWDQGMLADQIGVSRKWVVEVEGGKPRAEIGLVLRAFAALGLRLSAVQEPPSAAASPIDDEDLAAILSEEVLGGLPENRS